MGLKLNGATSGSIELDVPAAVSGGDISLTLPNGVGSAGQYLRNSGTAGTLEFADGGKVLQMVSNYTYRSSEVLISKDTTSLAAQYGFSIANRNYSDLETLTITPKSSTSTLVLIGTVGVDKVSTRSNTGAEGVVFVKDNTTGYEFSTYPGYDATYIRTIYLLPKVITMPIASGGTSAQTWYLKGYSYNESGGSATNQFRVKSTSFVIMEVES